MSTGTSGNSDYLIYDGGAVSERFGYHNLPLLWDAFARSTGKIKGSVASVTPRYILSAEARSHWF